VPAFMISAHCRSPAEEVWKLLYDPYRFAEWWTGMARVENVTGETVTRYMAEWPDFPYPTRVTMRNDGARVVISCLLSDIIQEWTLEPDGVGCVIRLRVKVPEPEAARLASVRDELEASLPRLVAAAERA
jgi:Polyketide cyclase / dehydrase and lipid transport